MSSAAVLLAAGRSSRMHGATADKILAPLAGRPAVAYSVEAFLASGVAATLAMVYRDAAQREALGAALEEFAGSARWIWIAGGQERQDSVLSALDALPEETQFVFIHDCARPLIRPETLRALDRLARRDGAACLARRLSDTVKELPQDAEPGRPARLRTLERSRLWASETPQAFAFTLIRTAYRRLAATGLKVTDDAAALEAAEGDVTLLENPHPNPKLTTPTDLAYLEFLATHPSFSTP